MTANSFINFSGTSFLSFRNGSDSTDWTGTLTLLAAVPIPEPSTYVALFGVASLGLVAWRRRRTA